MISFVLSKMLVVFVYPLGGAILVGAATLALTFTKWRRIERLMLGFALAVLWISAAPAFANWLNFRLESPYPPANIQESARGRCGDYTG